MSNIVKLPTLAELTVETETTKKENALMVLLNQPPPEKWLTEYPAFMKMPKDAKYIPIGRIKYLLHRIYTKWWVEVIDRQVMANAVTCTVRLFVVNPITGETEHNDGVGGVDIQTEKGASAMDSGKTKAMAIMKALPAAKSFAIKDAAEEFGKIFGRDLSLKEDISYMGLLQTPVELDDLRELFELKKDSMSPEKREEAERIISTQEKDSYKKLLTNLKAL